MSYNFDGEIHALSDEWAYIIKKTECITFESGNSKLAEFQKEVFRKYAEYLYENDKENVIQMLIDNLNFIMPYGSTSREDMQLIYRPPKMCGALAQWGTLALKFKRCQKDSLHEGNH